MTHWTIEYRLKGGSYIATGIDAVTSAEAWERFSYQYKPTHDITDYHTAQAIPLDEEKRDLSTVTLSVITTVARCSVQRLPHDAWTNAQNGLSKLRSVMLRSRGSVITA